MSELLMKLRIPNSLSFMNKMKGEQTSSARTAAANKQGAYMIVPPAPPAPLALPNERSFQFLTGANQHQWKLQLSVATKFDYDQFRFASIRSNIKRLH